MKRLHLLPLILLNLISLHSFSQRIQSGPMLGYSEMREVLIWIQTSTEAKVSARYWSKNNILKKYLTEEVKTNKETAFTAKLIADKVQPGGIYEYEILLNGKPVKFNYPLSFKSKSLWQHRENPPDVKFVMGSCTYVNDSLYDRPGEPYGGGYEIFKTIYEKKPDLMLWLGDNTYLREADWDTRTGIFHRYTNTRSFKELQPLLASIHHYAVWDDHDYGPNDSDRSFWNKNTTYQAFKLFWGNPSFGVGDLKGITTQFNWSDCEFFMLDNRFFRAPNNQKAGECTILGKEQIQWLIDALVSSRATFKFILMGGQFLNPGKVFETFSNLCEQEKNLILNRIAEEKIPGVIFLTGDRHLSEVTKLERPGTYPIYDFTVSPLTAKPYTKPKEENNYLRLEGSLVTERNFGQFEISGSKSERQLKYTVFTTTGEEKYSLIIKAKELK